MDRLPDAVVASVFAFLSAREVLGTCALTNRQWRAARLSPMAFCGTLDAVDIFYKAKWANSEKDARNALDDFNKAGCGMWLHRVERLALHDNLNLGCLRCHLPDVVPYCLSVLAGPVLRVLELSPGTWKTIAGTKNVWSIAALCARIPYLYLHRGGLELLHVPLSSNLVSLRLGSEYGYHADLGRVTLPASLTELDVSCLSQTLYFDLSACTVLRRLHMEQPGTVERSIATGLRSTSLSSLWIRGDATNSTALFVADRVVHRLPLLDPTCQPVVHRLPLLELTRQPLLTILRTSHLLREGSVTARLCRLDLSDLEVSMSESSCPNNAVTAANFSQYLCTDAFPNLWMLVLPRRFYAYLFAAMLNRCPPLVLPRLRVALDCDEKVALGYHFADSFHKLVKVSGDVVSTSSRLHLVECGRFTTYFELVKETPACVAPPEHKGAAKRDAPKQDTVWLPPAAFDDDRSATERAREVYDAIVTCLRSRPSLRLAHRAWTMDNYDGRELFVAPRNDLWE